MKVLMTTEKLDTNDSIFAFSHDWVKELALQVDQLTVIALSVGKYDVPSNVKVLSLGKEKNSSTIERIICFYKYIWQERKNYDAVFVHMNQIYVLLGGIFWRLWGKKIGLWYTHKKISMSLHVAVFLCHYVFTAAQESFNIHTSKKHVLGHGIETRTFLNTGRKKVFSSNTFTIVSVGRITQIKDLATLIFASKILLDAGYLCRVRLIGPQVTKEDDLYRKVLDQLMEKLVVEKDIVFVGGLSADEIKKELWQADVSVNLCPTGGLDKAVIESVCAGLHTFVANKAFRESFKEDSESYIFDYKSPQSLAQKIEKIIQKDRKDSQEQISNLQNIFVSQFEVGELLRKVVLFLNN